MVKQKKVKSCCSAKTKKKEKAYLSGITFGLIPHIGCIAFIIASVLGVTAAATFFRPLLLNAYFFYGLIALSVGFATIAAYFYLRRGKSLSATGVKRNWKYLTTMYGLTIGVNLFLFMIIFPLATNVMAASGPDILAENQGFLKLKSEIPCPGHAPLVTGDLRALEGVGTVNFGFPNYFSITYDTSKVSKEDILGLDVFNSFPASIVEESNSYQEPTREMLAQPQTQNSCTGTCGCGAV